MSLNIDVKLITDNLVELLTNTINMSSLFEQIFNSGKTEVQDFEKDGYVETTQYVYNDETQTIEPKNIYVEKISYLKDELAGAVGSKTSVLTQAEYQRLVDRGEVDPDVLYFIK